MTKELDERLQRILGALEDQDLIRQLRESEEDVDAGRTKAWSVVTERS